MTFSTVIAQMMSIADFEPVSGLYLVHQGTPRHVIRPAHPVYVAISSTPILAHWLELLPLAATTAESIHLIPPLLCMTYVDIPSFTPTIAAPNSSHAYSYHNPPNIPC